jgi:hypothetical protein
VADQSLLNGLQIKVLLKVALNGHRLLDGLNQTKKQTNTQQASNREANKQTNKVKQN